MFNFLSTLEARSNQQTFALQRETNHPPTTKDHSFNIILKILHVIASNLLLLHFREIHKKIR